MRIAGTIAGIILVLLGALWVLQGANIVGGSVMSGKSAWLYVGIVLVIFGLMALIWTYRRRR
jgi:hypothetical protein